MLVLAVCGSLNRASSNLGLLEAAAVAAPPTMEVRLFDGIRDLPLFDPDLENADGIPPAVRAWRAALRDSQAVLIATPAYGHSLPGSLKNAIDWVIGSGELYQKPVAITASVPVRERGQRGLDALRQTLLAVDATIVGGAPIVRGPTFDPELAALLAELAAPRS